MVAAVAVGPALVLRIVSVAEAVVATDQTLQQVETPAATARAVVVVRTTVAATTAVTAAMALLFCRSRLALQQRATRDRLVTLLTGLGILFILSLHPARSL